MSNTFEALKAELKQFKEQKEIKDIISSYWQKMKSATKTYPSFVHWDILMDLLRCFSGEKYALTSLSL